MSIHIPHDKKSHGRPERVMPRAMYRAMHSDMERKRPLWFAGILGLLLTFTVNSLALAGQLTVENGSGSGDYQNGEQAHIFADPSDIMGPQDANAEPAIAFPVLRIFDRWVGNTQFLEDPFSPRTIVNMPASNVSVRAEYKDVTPWAMPSVLSHIPPNHIGVIFLFHGKDGCAACMTIASVLKPFFNEATARGYAVIIPEKLRSEEPTWDPETDPDLNVDMTRISEIRRDLIDSGRIAESDPVHLVGLSAGGQFASLFDGAAQQTLDFPVASSVLLVAPGYSETMSGTQVPTLFAFAENDTSVDLNAGLTSFHSLVSRGVTTQAVIARPMPVHSRYFWSIDGINANDSQAIFTALDSAGFLDGDGFLIENPRDSNWQAVIPAPFNGPNFEGSIKDYLFQAYAEHTMVDSFINRIFSFIEAPLTEVDFIPEITSFSPGSGGAGTQVTINGKFFIDIESVTFDGIEATFSQAQSHVLTAMVPAGVTTGPVSVSNRAGTAISPEDFGAQGIQVSSMQPQSGPYGTVVEFVGSGLFDTETVTFNGVQASFSVTGVDTLIAAVPVGAVDGPVVLSTASSSADAGDFDVLSPPVVTAVSPDRTFIGETVSILGENLAPTTSVSLGESLEVNFTVISDNELEFQVPQGAPRWSRVIVTTPYGAVAAPGYFGAR